ncbi:MAG TPA: hypothetical protein VL172_15490 [Kofleriaceae bacterium]|jgi:hypothetical protein|nr:hypothetical protein [Kofleriaceae bacterium]
MKKTAGSLLFITLFVAVTLFRLKPEWFLFGPKQPQVQPQPVPHVVHPLRLRVPAEPADQNTGDHQLPEATTMASSLMESP